MPQTTDIEGLVRYLVTSLVEDTEAVRITTREGESSTVFEISVAADDTGKVIGRQGRIIKAIRVLARAAGSLNDQDIDVEVVG